MAQARETERVTYVVVCVCLFVCLFVCVCVYLFNEIIHNFQNIALAKTAKRGRASAAPTVKRRMDNGRNGRVSRPKVSCSVLQQHIILQCSNNPSESDITSLVAESLYPYRWQLCSLRYISHFPSYCRLSQRTASAVAHSDSRAALIGWHYLSNATNTASIGFYGITCLIRLTEFAALFATCEEHMCYRQVALDERFPPLCENNDSNSEIYIIQYNINI